MSDRPCLPLPPPPGGTPTFGGAEGPPVDPQHTLAGDTLARLGVVVPLRPGVVADLLAADPTDRAAVTELTEADPALAALLLGVLHAGGPRADDDADGLAPPPAAELINRLGARPARAVGLAAGARTLLPGGDDAAVPNAARTGWWDVSLTKAHAARLACRGVAPGHDRAAYLLGLIADLALPLLMRLDPAFYREVMPVRPAGQSWSAAERQRFGVDHAQAGAHLLSRWNVPAAICRLVREHHRAPAGGRALPLRTALYVSGLVPHAPDARPRPDAGRRLAALHGHLLKDHYATPLAFVESARFAAGGRRRRDAPRDAAGGFDPGRLLAAVAADVTELAGRTHRLENARNRQAEDLSTLRFEAYTDSLTKVLNRRGFFDLAQQRIDKRCGELSALCMLLDLNKFKPVNDEHGHDAGDLMLRGLAKLLRRSVSRTDLIGRLGGDEFVVLITDLTEAGARSAADRLYGTCHNVQLRLSDTLTLPLLLSLGAVYRPRLDSAAALDQMLAAADELMYRQKRAGVPGLRFGHARPPAAAETGSDAREPDPDAPEPVAPGAAPAPAGG